MSSQVSLRNACWQSLYRWSTIHTALSQSFPAYLKSALHWDWDCCNPQSLHFLHRPSNILSHFSYTDCLEYRHVRFSLHPATGSTHKQASIRARLVHGLASIFAIPSSLRRELAVIVVIRISPNVRPVEIPCRSSAHTSRWVIARTSRHGFQRDSMLQVNRAVRCHSGYYCSESEMHIDEMAVLYT